MKTKKIVSFISTVFVLLILFLIKFSLSSSCKNCEPYDDGIDDLCENLNHAEDETALLHVSFRPDGGWYNIPYRHTGFDSFVPAEDLRSGYPDPANSLVNGMSSYYCFVEVTTPDCLDWVHTTRMTDINGGGNANMTIQVPRRDNLWNLNIRVRYYERCSNGTYSDNNGTLRYSYEYTFQGGLPTSTSETIELIAEAPFSCNDFGNTGGGGIIGIILDEIEIQQP